MSVLIVRERDLYATAARALDRPEREVKRAVTALRPAGIGSWRAEEKAATLAGWLALRR
jgi:hypothetical protein